MKPEVVAITPNPAGLSVQLYIKLPVPQPVSLSLIDPRGRQFWKEEPGIVLEYRNEIDVKALPSGIYYLRLGTGNTVTSYKVAVIH